MLNRERLDWSDRTQAYRASHIDPRGIGVLLLGVLSRRPADSIGVVVATLAAVAIFINAVFLQVRPHPAPIFAPRARPVAISQEPTGAVVQAIPRPRPADVDMQTADATASARTRAQIVADIQRELSRRGFYDGPTDGIYGTRTDAAVQDFAQLAGLKFNAEMPDVIFRAIMQSPLKATAAKPSSAQGSVAARPNDPIAALLAPSKRILAVQRAIGDFGYGQLAPTGVLDPETRTAIERFERERKLPITGQITDRLMRELAAATGRPLE